ncbi:MAG: hypothetical protein EXQ81_09265 [Thermoleophilia bacterium]|nr:hypothetical protein [Thermoleophilia bacterium]
MPLGIGIMQVSRLVREVHALEGASPWIAVSGPSADALATTLAARGDRGAIVVGGNPVAAAVSIRLIEGEPTPAELLVLRRLARDETPVIVVRHGGTSAIPYVLPEDVLDGGPEPDIEELAAAIARAAPHAAPALAARLPLLRPAVSRRLIAVTAFANAALAASPRLQRQQLPVLTLAQLRMLFLLGITRGETLPRDPQGLAVAAGPYLAVSLATGIAARALVRQLPFGGPAVRAAVAYGSTRALGAALRRLQELESK